MNALAKGLDMTGMKLKEPVPMPEVPVNVDFANVMPHLPKVK